MISEYSVRAFKSLMNTEGNFFVPGDSKLYIFMNTLIDMGMVVNQWIYLVFDFILEKLNSNAFFDTYLPEVFGVATNFYNTLLSNLGYVFVVCTLVTLLCIFFFSNPIQAIKRFLLLLVVIAVNIAIFTHGETIVKDLNHGIDEVENVVLRTITVPMFGEKDAKLMGPQQEVVVTHVSMNGANAMETIRETYAKLTLYQSFAMVNFGEVEFNQEKYGKFLYSKEEEQNSEKRKEAIERREKEVKKASEKNVYLTPDSFGEKLIFSLYGIANNLVIGLPLVFIQLAKFVLKLFVFVLILLLPIPAVLSLFPKFQSSVLSALGKMVAVLSVGSFATLAMFLVFFIMTLIDKIIFLVAKAGVPASLSVTGQVALSCCFVSFLIKLVVLIAIWKFKGEILSFVTGGHITIAKDQTKLTMPNTGKGGYMPLPPELLLALNQLNHVKQTSTETKPQVEENRDSRDYVTHSPEVVEKEQKNETMEPVRTPSVSTVNEEMTNYTDNDRIEKQEYPRTNEGYYAYPELNLEHYDVEHYDIDLTEYVAQDSDYQSEGLQQDDINNFYDELRFIREG